MSEKYPWIKFYYGRGYERQVGWELTVAWMPFTPPPGEGYFRYKHYVTFWFSWPVKISRHP